MPNAALSPTGSMAMGTLLAQPRPATAEPDTQPSGTLAGPLSKTPRRLAVAAGFYTDGKLAELVRRCLVDDHQLAPWQFTLLAPADAERQRFERAARRWARPGRPGASSPGSDSVARRGPVTQAWGALHRWLAPRPRFDTTVRGRLQAGHWALLVHHVPADRQVALVRDLRRTGVSWCAEAPHVRFTR